MNLHGVDVALFKLHGVDVALNKLECRNVDVALNEFARCGCCSQ